MPDRALDSTQGGQRGWSAEVGAGAKGADTGAGFISFDAEGLAVAKQSQTASAAAAPRAPKRPRGLKPWPAGL